MHRYVSEIFLAGLIVNQTDDECPHDPTPSLEPASKLTEAGFRTASWNGKMVSSRPMRCQDFRPEVGSRTSRGYPQRQPWAAPGIGCVRTSSADRTATRRRSA